MYKLILIILSSLQPNAYATVDSNTNVFIPVQHIQSGEYFIQRAPLIGCYGLPRGPQLQQLTRPYLVNNLGCGTTTKENINALKCASVISSEEADDYSTFKKITLDISDCKEKNNKSFIYVIKKVVRLNFSTKTNPYPKLILVKTNGKRFSSDLF